ncbi:hypothetical protein IWW38_005126 [Coemansia aciculifera]|uniref:Uncharacterized protein n=1 Tax=Coemansia aciculifera TaxID=417176 RepID=A0ACC1LVM2_9FUNG|nr:hypothetical protein IWW38_005126 [Coemansia aciculifera]
MTIVTVVVEVPIRKTCNDCDDYEEFRDIDTETTTVGQLKAVIATRFGVSSDEFIFETTFPKATQDILARFEAFVLTPSTEKLMLKGKYVPDKWLMLNLFANPEFKGEGPLKSILDKEPPRYCDTYYQFGGGQLAKRLKESIAEFNRQKLE